jgi:hypothetical protein
MRGETPLELRRKQVRYESTPEEVPEIVCLHLANSFSGDAFLVARLGISNVVPPLAVGGNSGIR